MNDIFQNPGLLDFEQDLAKVHETWQTKIPGQDKQISMVNVFMQLMCPYTSVLIHWQKENRMNCRSASELIDH